MDALTLENQHIIAVARGWIGTRFRHQGRMRAQPPHSGGVDCLGLLIGVASALELRARDGSLLAAHDTVSYSKSPDGVALRRTLDKLLWPVSAAACGPGDIALFLMDGQPQHVAILTEYPVGTGEAAVLGMVHAYAQARRVVEHRLDDAWRKRLVSAYRCA